MIDEGFIPKNLGSDELTLRDRLAAAALTGLMTAENATKITTSDQYKERLLAIVEVCYDLADAILRRGKQNE